MLLIMCVLAIYTLSTFTLISYLKKMVMFSILFAMTSLHSS
nr:MAG TPA: hypothetical protein [Caudoviricetes sp.]